MTEEALLALWGKTDRNHPERYHPLLFHMLDAAAVCEALLPRFGEVAPLPRGWLLYLVALHDIGKADPLFQSKSPAQAGRLRQQGWKIPETSDGFRHEARSARWVHDHLLQEYCWGPAARVISAALHGHHGDFQSPLNDGDEEQRPGSRFALWEEIRSEAAARLRGILDLEPFRLDRFPHASAAGARLAGLVVLADWIASNEELLGALDLAHSLRNGTSWPRPEDYFSEARASAAQVVGRMHLDALPPGPAVGMHFAEVWPECSSLRPSQAALEHRCLTDQPRPGLAIIEAPMGEGKTEAAIYLAEHWRRATGRDGVYIALPTAATSNQMHGRYAEFLCAQHPQSPAPRLVHGMAWLIDDIAPETPVQADDGTAGAGADEERSRALDWFRPSKRALIAPEGVGTVDQALMGALHVKHGFLRLLGLSSKVLIVDEVHAYDAYMTTILCRLLAWCRALGAPVILLSATLAHAQKAQLARAYAGEDVLPPPAGEGRDPYPLLTFVPLDGGATLVPVSPTDQAEPGVEKQERARRLEQHAGFLSDPKGIACLAASLVKNGGCACVLANTVKDAQRIYRHLRRLRLPGTRRILFHARFPARRRNALERQVVTLFGKDAGEQRPKRAIVVATQVIEQSLDVDFDVMVTQLAPMDLLLQRCGRMHRHERGPRPTGPDAVLHVLLPDAGVFEFGVTERVYEREILLRTLALLHDRRFFRLPADFRELVEGCYGEQPIGEAVVPSELLAAAARKRAEDLLDQAEKARYHLIPDPDPGVFTLAQARGPVDESEEGDRASYFRAQTRLGDDSRSALVLSNPALLAAARTEEAPRRTVLKRLFLQKVNLPAWWFGGLLDSSGARADFRGPRWLRDCLVIPMDGGEWRGREEVKTGEYREVTLRDDPRLGLLRRVEGEDDDDV